VSPALRAPVPSFRERVPDAVGVAGMARELQGGGPGTRRYLEIVPVVVAVVGDHVHDENAGHPCPGQVDGFVALQPQPQCPFDEGPAEMPCAHAVGRELLPREVEQPDVPLEAPLLGQLEEDRRGRDEGRGRRMVVVRPGRGEAGPGPAFGRVVDVFHVSRVVMVGQDDRLPPVPPRDDDEDVALVGAVLLVLLPAAEEREMEVRPPVERDFSAQGFPLQAGLPDGFPVPPDEVLPEGFEVAVAVGEAAQRPGVLGAVRVVLIDIAAVRDDRDVLPEVLFECARRGRGERQGIGNPGGCHDGSAGTRGSGGGRFEDPLDLATDGLPPDRFRRLAGESGDPGIQGFFFGQAQHVPGEIPRERPSAPELEAVEERQDVERCLMGVVLVQVAVAPHGREVGLPPEQTRPEPNGAGWVWRIHQVSS
jgi:hypothetical protein